MGKIAFIFPGQGAQYVGMGKEIIQNYGVSQDVFNMAKNCLDFDLEAICFEENEQIHKTEYTQPALLSVSISILKAIETLGLKPDVVAGLSLGEYSALVANGALDFQTAVKLVRKRGQFMEAAALETKGSMAAILKAGKEEIQEVISQVSGVLEIANYNSSQQIVISGEISALEESYPLFSAKGIKAIPLTVSGAFHSSLMNAASLQLEKEISQIGFNSFEIPYVTNVTASYVQGVEQIGELLVTQVASSVRWEESVLKMIEEGVDLFVEIGPGKTLTGLIKKIDRKVKVLNVEDLASLELLRKELEV